MKKIFCFFVMMGICVGVFAFDRSLNGRWGLAKVGEELEFIKFNDDVISIMGSFFSPDDYEETDNSIYIEDEDKSILIQYYLLSPGALLFIVSNSENFNEGITLILSRL
jgi:hypothetical protein